MAPGPTLAGWENFADPIVAGQQASLFYCGPEGPGRAIVEQLIADVGLEPVWVGGLETAGLIDNLAGLWFALARGRGMGRRLAIKLLRE